MSKYKSLSLFLQIFSAFLAVVFILTRFNPIVVYKATVLYD